jgi:hypothetical protein
VEETLRVARPQSTDIVLGHRNDPPVVATQRDTLYAFGGDEEAVISYLRDLALHTLLSHRSTAEVWTTDDLTLPDVPGLRAFRDTRSLVSELEVEVLKRHRPFDEEDLKDWSSHQDAWPDDPLPLVVGIAISPTVSFSSRLEAIATQADDLGLVVLTVGSGPDLIEVEKGQLSPRGEFKDLWASSLLTPFTSMIRTV